MYLFSQAKSNRILRVPIFVNSKVLKISRVFLRMASFWKLLVYKFYLKIKKNKKRQLNHGHSANVSVKIYGETGRSRRKNCCYWLILKKLILPAFFVHFFFVYFAKYGLCAYLACINFRECCLRENFACI